MSILSRYTVREVAAYTVAAFLIVLAVFLITRLATLLADAAVGALPGGVVLELLALRTLMALPSLLPAVFYIGVLLGLGRLARDLEITALAACGVRPWRLHRAVLVFAAAAAIGVGFLSFAGRPWAAARFNTVRDRAVAEAGLENVTPGIFYDLGYAVVFAEGRAAAQPEYLENVFVQQRTNDALTVFAAKQAVESRDTTAGVRFLTLLDGVRYDLDPDGKNQEITRFRAFTLRAPVSLPEPDLGVEKTVSAAALLRSEERKAQAELQWRSAMPISTVLLAFLAVALVRDDGIRRGRYTSLFPAVLLYVAYRTLLGTAKNWIGDGALAPMPGLWLIHGTCLLVALAVMLRPASFDPRRLFRLQALASSKP